MALAPGTSPSRCAQWPPTMASSTSSPRPTPTPNTRTTAPISNLFSDELQRRVGTRIALSLGLRFPFQLRKHSGSASQSASLHHRRYQLPAGGVQQLLHPSDYRRESFSADSRRLDADPHASRAQPAASADSTNGRGLGFPGLPGAGHRLGSYRTLGTPRPRRRRVAARERRSSRPRNRRSRHRRSHTCAVIRQRCSRRNCRNGKSNGARGRQSTRYCGRAGLT